ncbi:tRNA-dihydrouridine synthase family protein [bacterium]|nr:tRNA-dihydrouridine synthase family protein [bacterium]
MRKEGEKMGVKGQGNSSSQMRLGLAPMEGVTDFATRLWVTQHSAPDFTTTPFLRVTKDYPCKRISANFFPESGLSREHGIVTCLPQLMASEEDDLIRIARHFLESVPFVDINCGCPSPTVVGHGAGSSLLRDPRRFESYLGKIVEALGAGRVSVKMRLGFDHQDEFFRLLDVLAPLPLARLTIHGRTRADRYTGYARWSFMETAARRLPYPVYGSGDVVDRESLQERLKIAPSIAGVIVGRGALRNPWIFSNLRGENKKTGRDYFRSALVQFVLLQELQANHWSDFLSAVMDGVFAPMASASNEDPRSIVDEQNRELLMRTLFRDQTFRREPRDWQIGRVSVARAKMIWNYLRSGLKIAPESTVALLRATDWSLFLDALDKILDSLDEDDIGLEYHKSWDWVFAGAGRSEGSPEVPGTSGCS